jgi:hypothetical protein
MPDIGKDVLSLVLQYEGGPDHMEEYVQQLEEQLERLEQRGDRHETAHGYFYFCEDLRLNISDSHEMRAMFAFYELIDHLPLPTDVMPIIQSFYKDTKPDLVVSLEKRVHTWGSTRLWVSAGSVHVPVSGNMRPHVHFSPFLVNDADFQQMHDITRRLYRNPRRYAQWSTRGGCVACGHVIHSNHSLSNAVGPVCRQRLTDQLDGQSFEDTIGLIVDRSKKYLHYIRERRRRSDPDETETDTDDDPVR